MTTFGYILIAVLVVLCASAWIVNWYLIRGTRALIESNERLRVVNARLLATVQAAKAATPFPDGEDLSRLDRWQ